MALRLCLSLAFLWCLLALAGQGLLARARGTRRLFAPAAGSPAAGVRYAFLKGMMPGAKESAREHLPTYALGILYHGGLACAFLLLALRVAAPAWIPGPAIFAALPGAGRILGLAAFAGGLAGAALLVKRACSSSLRALSRPDDFLSNALATLFCLLALPAGAGRAWLLAAAALLLWIPCGKIRHVLFFFETRRHFGAFFGRRGVLPRREV
jgi:hypothetical protein